MGESPHQEGRKRRRSGGEYDHVCVGCLVADVAEDDLAYMISGFE